VEQAVPEPPEGQLQLLSLPPFLYSGPGREARGWRSRAAETSQFSLRLHVSQEFVSQS